MAKFLKLLTNEKGATAIEYGLIAALIAVAAITAMTTVGSELSVTFNNVSGALGSFLRKKIRRCGNAPPFSFVAAQGQRTRS